MLHAKVKSGGMGLDGKKSNGKPIVTATSNYCQVHVSIQTGPGLGMTIEYH